MDVLYTKKGVHVAYPYWINRLGADQFQNLVNYQDMFEPGAQRFDMGEKSQFHTMPMVVESLTFIEKLKIKNIAEHCGKLIEFFISHLGPLNDEVRYWDKDQRSENILGLYFKDINFLERVKKVLAENRCYVSYRGTSMRISPNIYNDTQDMEKLLQLIKKTLMSF